MNSSLLTFQQLYNTKLIFERIAENELKNWILRKNTIHYCIKYSISKSCQKKKKNEIRFFCCCCCCIIALLYCIRGIKRISRKWSNRLGFVKGIFYTRVDILPIYIYINITLLESRTVKSRSNGKVAKHNKNSGNNITFR